MSDGAQTARLGRSASSMLALAARYGAWIALAALLLTLPKLFTSSFVFTLLSLMGISVIFALSYNMLLGQAGMLSFGHAVYYGLGGFLVVHAMNTITKNSIPIPLPLMPLVGGFAGLLFGIIFGSVSTRRGGTAFAMISLGLSELVASSALILRSFFGGEEGITTNRTKLLRVFDLSFGSQIQVYYLIAIWCFICVLAMYALTRTPLGRMCNAVRDNFERAEFVGYNPQLIRFFAFCLSGFFAGIAGGLAAINFEIVNSGYVGAEQSGTVLLAAYIGGIGFFTGPIIGAVLVTWLQVMLSDITEVWQLYFGLLFVGMVMFAPFGISGLLMMHAPLWRARVLWRVVPAYLLGLAAGLVMLMGACLMIEMAYHLSTKASEGPMMSFMHVGFSAHSFWPWLLAVTLLAGGYFFLRSVWPYVEGAWHDALMKARERGSAA
jgi:branched-chain amino acid transport system permease protein